MACRGFMIGTFISIPIYAGGAWLLQKFVPALSYLAALIILALACAAAGAWIVRREIRNR